MKDYELILKARSDVSDWLLHMTADFETLKEILADGYLKATVGRRPGGMGSQPTIRGPHPAVCFSEMPIWAAATLSRTELKKQRYRPYGVAVSKTRIYRLGGRKVIYGDLDLLGQEIGCGEDGYLRGRRICEGGLDAEFQYLWVYHNLEKETPIDWTHEREWRICGEPPVVQDFPVEGCPLELSAWSPSRPPTFCAFVGTRDEERRLREFLNNLSVPAGATEYVKAYYPRLQKLVILVIEEVHDTSTQVEDLL